MQSTGDPSTCPSPTHHRGTTWQEGTHTKQILELADIPIMFALLRQRRLHELDHMDGGLDHMDGGFIPKDVL